MAINDILGQSGDKQDYIVEIPAGNSTYYPQDILVGEDEAILCAEIPQSSSGNIFIMSE
jgi:hypothetical protein